eukprot:9172541-Alexandrium_andersonii.AAC.1
MVRSYSEIAFKPSVARRGWRHPPGPRLAPAAGWGRALALARVSGLQIGRMVLLSSAQHE